MKITLCLLPVVTAFCLLVTGCGEEPLGFEGQYTVQGKRERISFGSGLASRRVTYATWRPGKGWVSPTLNSKSWEYDLVKKIGNEFELVCTSTDDGAEIEEGDAVLVTVTDEGVKIVTEKGSGPYHGSFTWADEVDIDYNVLK